VRLLAPRGLTVHEVRTRLARRGYSREEIDAAIEELAARGFLDDRALAYNAATILAERRLYGRPRVAAELARRGVAADTIGEAFERAFAGLDEDSMARKAAGKGAGAVLIDRRARERTARSLLRRGFSRGAVARVLGGEDDGAAGSRADFEESVDLRHETDFERDP
jgi:regulatory protein